MTIANHKVGKDDIRYLRDSKKSFFVRGVQEQSSWNVKYPSEMFDNEKQTAKFCVFNIYF